MKNINQEHTGRKRIALVSGKFLSLSIAWHHCTFLALLVYTGVNCKNALC